MIIESVAVGNVFKKESKEGMEGAYRGTQDQFAGFSSCSLCAIGVDVRK